MSHQIFLGKDETSNRLKLNNDNANAQMNQWTYENTQTYHVEKRNESEQLQKQLQLEINWVKQHYLARIKDIKNKLNNHFPKWGTKLISKWSNADLDDFILHCKQALQDTHPNLKLTDSQVNQLAAALLTSAIQCEKLNSIFIDINAWLQHDSDWLFKHQKAIQTALQNVHDEEATDTTTATPDSSLEFHDYIRSFTETIKRNRLNTQQRNLQRYRIRTTIEQALNTQATPTPKKDQQHTTKQVDDGLSL